MTATTFENMERAVQSFTDVLDDLQAGHRRLEERARRVEAELCIANERLADKVAELDEVKRRLEAILAALPTGVVVREADGRIARVNRAALDILGCKEEALLGRDGHPGLQGAAANGEPRELEREDGARLVTASAYSPVSLDGGEALGSVEILDDRTELSRMTARAQQLDKMAALGTMAGGIAHEIRNPMNAIMGFAALLERNMQPDTKAARWAALIRDGVAEADAIISSMLSFARLERLHYETIDGPALLAEVVDTVRRDLERRGIEQRYELTCQAEAGEIVVDRIKLRQAVRNLVANAVEAQPDGGPVHLALAHGRGEVVLRVTDAGPGIPPELHGRVTDPFFTTRADGTGLGLALVHTIVQLHGGALEIGREPSSLGGAEVLLRLPASPAD